jgi:hypothetical protein
VVFLLLHKGKNTDIKKQSGIPYLLIFTCGYQYAFLGLSAHNIYLQAKGKHMTFSNLVNEKRAAEILDCSVQTLRNDRSSKRRIPYVKLGKSVRYRPEDLAALISEHRITGGHTEDEGPGA